MKFALIDNIRIEATKGAHGICPNCGSEVIAKCGERKVNHWAHKSTRNCDPWWEPETEWHRSWKNNFPPEWQETSLRDEQTNEKHIADVRTSHGLVIEFQHSHIKPEERTAREAFYRNMVWVVDGARLKNDYPRFVKARKHFRHAGSPHIFVGRDIDSCFHSAWTASTVPVIFDTVYFLIILELKEYLLKYRVKLL
jgi:competence protein CoiA